MRLKLLLCDIVLVMLISSVATAAGDVDADGNVTRNDAKLILSYRVKLASLSLGQLSEADINGDGLVNAGDAIKLMQTLDTPYVIQSVSTSAASAEVGDTVTWTASTSGGYGLKLYRFMLYRDGALLDADAGYKSENTFVYKIDAQGVYRVRAYAKDEWGRVSDKTSDELTASQDISPLKIDSLSPDRTQAQIGESVSWTVSASGGYGQLSYKFTAYLNNAAISQAEASFDPTYMYKPTLKGEYFVKVEVTDARGDKVSLSGGNVTIPDPLYYMKPNITLTGDARKDMVALALTQVGYKESVTDYIPDGTDDIAGYTKYGHWYDIRHNGSAGQKAFIYGEWCCMFVTYIADEAKIPSSVVPSHAACSTGVNAFKMAGRWYNRDDGYTPRPGDIIYFDRDGGSADHVGIVKETIGSRVYTIEGNTSRAVKIKDYGVSDSQIMGYGLLEDKIDQEALRTDIPLPIKTNILSDSEQLITYYSINGTIAGHIDVVDEVTITKLYQSGWAYVTYPTPSGMKPAYCLMSGLFTDPSAPLKSETPVATETYARSDLSTKYGAIYTGDTVYSVGQRGNAKQVIYNIDGGWKMAWMSSSNPIPTPTPTPLDGVSENCVDFIKQHEGFQANRYADPPGSGKYSIGYGHQIQPGEGFSEPMSESTARELLKGDIASRARALKSFQTQYGVTLNQNQFDALVSMIYNCGTAVINDTCRVRTLLINYKNGSSIPSGDMYNAMARWHHAGGVDLYGLYCRRMNEARMFTEGIYERKLDWPRPSWFRDGAVGPDVPDDWKP